MRFIRQKNFRNCGQIAVAMLVDRPLEDITEVIPHSHGTRTKELVRALRHFGYSCPDRMQRKPIDFGLAQLHMSKSGWVIRGSWHWVAIGFGVLYPIPVKLGRVSWSGTDRNTAQCCSLIIKSKQLILDIALPVSFLSPNCSISEHGTKL